MSGWAGEKRFCAGCFREVISNRCSRPGCDWDQADRRLSQSHLGHHKVLASRYYLGRVLGQGGFGVTYKALDLMAPKPRVVAIKEYLPSGLCERADDGDTIRPYVGDYEVAYWHGLKRFLEEGQNLRKFSQAPYRSGSNPEAMGGHANIVGCSEVFEANGAAYLVMEFLPGLTLAQHLAEEGGGLEYGVALQLLMPAMDGLRAMHRERLVHRDVSPPNIMLTPLPGDRRGVQVKLVDFGAARFAISEHSQNLSIILKQGYAPAEQYYSNAKQGAWTDVYATAATFYRCITGVVPPIALNRNLQDSCVAPGVLYRERMAGRSGETELPPALDKVLMKGLAIKVADRYQTIEEFQDALQLAARKAPQNVARKAALVPAKRPELERQDAMKVERVQGYEASEVRPRSLKGWKIAGVVLLAVGAGIGGVSWKKSQSERNRARAIQLYSAKSYADAAVPLDRACTDGSSEACKDLGNLYRDGNGVAKDTVHAVSLFRKACDAGFWAGCNNLAVAYASGDGIGVDTPEAVKLYTGACEAGLYISCNNLGILYSSNPAIKNTDLAAHFYGKACDGKSADGCVNLADMYSAGGALVKDEPRAADLYSKACGLGEQSGCLALGVVYESGLGVTADPVRAVALYKGVCDSGQIMGCNNLGTMYLNGTGVPKNVARAVELYTGACDKGAAIACSNLATAYSLGGDGVPQDYSRAKDLYKKACDAGYATGCSGYGEIYRNGFGVEKDLTIAREYLDKGCKMHDSMACDKLKQFDLEKTVDDAGKALGDYFRGLGKP